MHISRRNYMHILNILRNLRRQPRRRCPGPRVGRSSLQRLRLRRRSGKYTHQRRHADSDQHAAKDRHGKAAAARHEHRRRDADLEAATPVRRPHVQGHRDGDDAGGRADQNRQRERFTLAREEFPYEQVAEHGQVD